MPRPKGAPILIFHGAAGTVTGSCFELDTGQARVLVDCGLFQGSKTERELNYRPFPFDARAIDAVILTHAHIDHAGLIPKLVNDGYTGPVYATAPTADLCGVMLPDSGHIQEVEVEQLNRRNRRRGRGEVTPIYTADDATVALTQFRGVAYETWTPVAEGIRARFWNAGHLLGSASVEVEAVGPDGETVRLLFSGDIGPTFKLLQHDPKAPTDVDHVICEATYGDTDREGATPEKRRRMLCDVVKAAMNPAGALLIPSFAVERTQELMVDLHLLMEAGDLPRIPVVIDSPLATRASKIFAQHAGELEEGAVLKRALAARTVRFTETVEQSKALDLMREFHIVIAASGMCEAGRIRHRLKNWLWRDEATVLLVGFQAEGTLGRILQDGASAVRIQGDEVKVRATIRSIDLYSGHADGPELEAWIEGRQPIHGSLFLVHGEGPAVAALKDRVAGKLGRAAVVAPALDQAFSVPKGRAAVALDEGRARRLEPAVPGHRDWHNDQSELVLDIARAMEEAADDRARGVILRRLKRALAEG
ncbi:MBL fold metallo-hydrolase RNA specificity domain-containing protein [Chthonobacter albigriseus]|uniref:MBL fold metallo-hydrolase RNA specificity domain-containing protein n=1 Tax=Chthonobacter albigriseus TaxID=1683161 RepID=UPI0015EF4401|nr:MBL fold metallo-hydrolase [Chthonobacter albigriseus]